MRWVEVWKLFAVQLGVFQLPLLLLLKFEVPFHKTLVAMVCAFFKPIKENPYGSGIIIKFTSASFPFKSMNICY